MPTYSPGDDLPSKQLLVKLPSTPGAEVWGPAELDFWQETSIVSKSQRSEADPQDQTKALIVTDQAMLEYMLLHEWLEHKEAGWNLFDENGVAFERTRNQIDGVFKGQKGRRDRQAILMELVKAFFPEMLQQKVIKEGDEEGNEHERRQDEPSTPSSNGGTTSIPSLKDTPSTDQSLQPIQS